MQQISLELKRIRPMTDKTTFEKSQLGPTYGGKWEKLKFGPYAGLTLPELFFLDLEYFDLLRHQCAHFVALEIQRAEMAERASHILPPKGYRDRRFLVRFSEDGSIKSVGLTEDRSASKLGWVTQHLDFAMYRSAPHGRRKSAKRIAKGLKQMFFGDQQKPPHIYQGFFEDRKNFAHGCTEEHHRWKCPKG